MNPRILLSSFIASVLAALPLRHAQAHAILMSSQPAAAGYAAAGELAVSLRFNSLIDVKRSRLVLVRPGGQGLTLQIAGAPTGETIVAHASVTPGDNVLRWQVLAVDGHITRGNVPFDVAPEENAKAAAAPAR